jgi:hypothetical protein
MRDRAGALVTTDERDSTDEAEYSAEVGVADTVVVYSADEMTDDDSTAEELADETIGLAL